MDTTKLKAGVRGVGSGAILMLAGLGAEHVADRVGAMRPQTLKVESTAVTLIDPAQAAMAQADLPLPKRSR